MVGTLGQGISLISLISRLIQSKATSLLLPRAMALCRSSPERVLTACAVNQRSVSSPHGEANSDGVTVLSAA